MREVGNNWHLFQRSDTSSNPTGRQGDTKTFHGHHGSVVRERGPNACIKNR